MLPWIYLIPYLIISLQANTISNNAASQTTLPTSFSNQVSPPISLPTAVPTFPNRRVFPTVNLGNGWHVQIATFECTLPISTAPLLLEHFYENIIRQTSVVRARETGLFRFRFGVITLAFECRQTVVPWYFVRRFAEMMLAYTRFVIFLNLYSPIQ